MLGLSKRTFLRKLSFKILFLLEDVGVNYNVRYIFFLVGGWYSWWPVRVWWDDVISRCRVPINLIIYIYTRQISFNLKVTFFPERNEPGAHNYKGLRSEQGNESAEVLKTRARRSIKKQFNHEWGGGGISVLW